MAKWIVTNCESVGNTHDVCQDHTEYMVSNDVYVGALADGVSSNKFSDIGAKTVTKIACEEMSKNFNKYFNGELTSQAFVRTIQSKMNSKYVDSYDLNQMKSTLLVCAIYKNNYIIGHIGDGAVLCFGKESYVISPPQENEVGGTATYTIMDYNADEHFQFKVGNMNYLDGFLMTSDGLLGNVYYSGIDIPQLAYELFGSVYKDTSPLYKDDRDALFKQYLAEHIQRDDPFADDCSLIMIARKKKTGYIDYNVINGFEADVKWPCKCGNMNRMDEIRCSSCRTMYTSLYPDSILKIKSKEGFFSKLQKWMNSNSSDEFDPGITAVVIDTSGFSAICNALRANSGNKVVSKSINHAYSMKNDNQGDAYEKSESQLKMGKEINSFREKHDDTSGSILGKMTKLGIGVIQDGWQQLVESDSVHYKHQKTKYKALNRKSDVQKIFPIVLSYAQMAEAAYQMKLLPMEFVRFDNSISITEDQKNAVKAMFYYEGFFDMFQHDEEVCITHYYKERNRTVAICDRMTNNLYCKFGNNARELLDDTSLIPRYCFATELMQCNKINSITINYRKVVLPWNWTITYFRCRADASEMFRQFQSIFNKRGYNLAKTRTNIWFVAGNRNPEEMVAYILTDNYLLRLKSLDKKFVEVEEVSPEDNCALQLRDRYLLKQ